MLGAIIGDMVGSCYELKKAKSKKFNIYNINNRMTDDSYLTLAVAKVLMNNYPIDYSKNGLDKIKQELVNEFVRTFKLHPYVGYGTLFVDWCLSTNHEPYNSFGNGSAMRISPVGWIANSEEEVKILSRTVSEITHNHIEGIKGAEAIAMCMYLARSGKDKEYIKNRMIKEYYPEIASLDYDELVKNYTFNATCQGSVPQAIYCFLISDSLEDAIRNCAGIGGDTDTLGAMAGAVAEAYYQKDSVSYFEEMFIYLFIDNSCMDFIKKFYHIVGNRKFISKE